MHVNGRAKVLSVVLVFVLMLSFVVSGCGSSTGAANTGSSKTAKLSGEFTFVCSQYSDATEPFFTDLVNKFQKENPGVKIDLQVVGWDVLEQKVNTMVSTNQAPDLLNIDAYSRYVDDNLLMPADKYVTKDLKNMRFHLGRLHPALIANRQFRQRRALFGKALDGFPAGFENSRGLGKKIGVEHARDYGALFPLRRRQKRRCKPREDELHYLALFHAQLFKRNRLAGRDDRVVIRVQFLSENAAVRHVPVGVSHICWMQPGPAISATVKVSPG